MKTRLLRKWFRQCEKDIKRNPFLVNLFSFHDEMEKTKNISNIPERRLNAHIYAKVVWNSSILLRGSRRRFEEKYMKYSRKYWTPKAIMERDLKGEND